LFLKAVPHSIGMDLAGDGARAQAGLISSSDSSPASRYLFISVFVGLGSGLDHASRATSSASSSEIGRDVARTRTSCPELSSSQMMAFILTQVDDALEVVFGADRDLRSAPGWPSGAPSSGRCTLKKLAPVRSILLTKAMRGTLYLSAWRQTVSDCGCTPPTAQNTVHAPSSTRSERSTSMVKSTWPGVSMMLMRCSGRLVHAFQKQVVAAEVMVMPRSCSCSIQSMVAAPSCTSPILWLTPV
jgi:hypothetical protein